MAKTHEHGRLIAAAAKAALAPIGCRRVGQSRTWISDQRYWLIVVEFQPSGWSKGTYLNVGAMWLWRARKGLAFHSGHRVADFVPFESPGQFAPLIAEMSARAAQEVVNLKEKFSSIAEIACYLADHATHDGWPIYHAAVAAGLAGDKTLSQRFFGQIEAWHTDSQDWREEIKRDRERLSALLDKPPKYRSAVLATIEKCRALNNLPPDPNCLDAIAPIVVQR